MSLRAKGMAAAKWSGLATVVSIVIQLAQLVTVSRMLTPQDYGLISMVMVVVGVAVTMSDMGISNAIIHRQSITREELSSLYALNLAVAGGIALAVWLIAPAVCYFYREPELLGPMRWMSLLVFVPAIGQQFQYLFQKELQFRYLSLVDMVSFAVGFTVAFAGAYYGYGVGALVGSYLANALFKSVCLAAAGWRIWKPAWHFSRRDLKGFISYGFYQMGSNMLQTLTSNLDYLILGRLVGAEKLGYYTFAYQLCVMPMQKLYPLVSQIALPLFAKMQDSRERLRSGYARITELVGYISGPIYLGLAATAPYLVPFAFGEQWTPSVLMIQIHAVMLLLRSVVIPTQSLLLAVGRADTRFYYSLYCLAIISPSLLIGAWAGGAIGVTWAYLAAQALIVAVNYYQSIRVVLGSCLREHVRSFMPGVLQSAAMAAGVLALGQLVSQWGSELLVLAMQVAWGVVLYALLVCLFNRRLVRDFREQVRVKYFKKESAG